MMTEKNKNASSVRSEERRKALGKLGKYAAGGSVALFAMSARSQSVTNCGSNGQTDPSDSAGGNNCD